MKVDILIIGAGPAGMAAALAAAPSGARIALLDDNPLPGGQIWRDGAQAQLPDGAKRYRQRIAAQSNIELLSSARVIAQAGPKALLVEAPQRGWVIEYHKLILCTGARELLLPFPGWTLPGVTGDGGLQALIKGGLPVAGERVVIAGSGPLLLQAFSLWHRGYRANSHVIEARGDNHLQAVRLSINGRIKEIACERLACGFGLIPNTQLGQALGCQITANAIAVDAWQASSLEGVYAAGECTGFAGSEKALVEGAIAGHAAVDEQAAAQRLWPQRERWQSFATALSDAFALGEEVQQLARPDTLICRCEDVPLAALAEHESWSQAKLASRCGMGACQGRICGAASQVLFGWQPPAPRPPFSPARIDSLLQLGQRE
ncbi:FAD/NAD(P)-binding oxidoreductase [Pseudomonas anguilliseptica]|uniref:FAD/NAD(P)-binding oxidoreductase n=1 Tax=Pseudomonas anguilliseptica TaxID=53406 RepID=UPI00325B739F